MGLVFPDGRWASQLWPSIGIEWAGLMQGCGTVRVCLDYWIRPIIIGRGHEAYFAVNV